MKTVDRAFFAGGGARLATIVSNRVELHDVASDNGKLTPEKRWTAKVSHAAHVAQAPRAGRIIVTDTKGCHHGLCLETGAEIWTVKGPGEGSAGVVVPDPSGQACAGEMFLFLSRKGSLQRLDAQTGEALAPLHDFPHRVPRLYLACDTDALVIEKNLRPDVDESALCRLDLDPVGVTELMPITASFGAILSPDQRRIIAADHYDVMPGDASTRGQIFTIIEVPSGRRLAERRFAAGHFPVHEAQWSPDGRWILIFEGDEAHLLDSATLETRGAVAAERHRRSAFHPNGTHICISRSRTSAIVALQDIMS